MRCWVDRRMTRGWRAVELEGPNGCRTTAEHPPVGVIFDSHFHRKRPVFERGQARRVVQRKAEFALEGAARQGARGRAIRSVRIGLRVSAWTATTETLARPLPESRRRTVIGLWPPTDSDRSADQEMTGGEPSQFQTRTATSSSSGTPPFSTRPMSSSSVRLLSGRSLTSILCTLLFSPMSALRPGLRV